MAITNTNTPWVNSDGLSVRFADMELIQGKGGEIGGVHETLLLELDVAYTDFTEGTDGDGATAVKIVDYNLFLPTGCQIERILFATGTAWATATAINFGTVRRTDFTTIIDADGLVDSLAITTIDTENAIVPIYNEGAGTYAGALLDDVGGPIATYDAVICMFYEGSAPTAGTGKLRIFYRPGSGAHL